jgi:aryl-alcohol dehydrogenase-like predicted oxidoreductase
VGREIRAGHRRARSGGAGNQVTFNAQAGNPNAGGNGRKKIRRALEGSLRRLQTDCVDLYWMHACDRVMSVEEVISTLNDLVQEGKILHIGLSDVPAWYAARAQTIAELRVWDRLAACSWSIRASIAWKILPELIRVSGELGKTPAETALHWVATQPDLVSTLTGAIRLEQLESNLRVFEFEIPADCESVWTRCRVRNPPNWKTSSVLNCRR